MRSAARPPWMTVRSPPRYLHAARAVGLLCIYPAYILLIFSIGSRKIIGRYYSGGKSSGKFSLFCCVYYAYALYKLLLPQVEPAACFVLLVKS